MQPTSIGILEALWVAVQGTKLEVLRTDTRSYAVDCDDVDNDADVEVADVDADDVIADDVDSGLQSTDTHTAICC